MNRNWLLLLLLLAVVGVAVGQLIIETRGVSGQLCGNYRHCLRVASCSKNRSSCLCPDGLTGNAKLGCFPSTRGVCYLQADPDLLNLYKEYIPIPTPCMYRLMKYNVFMKDFGTCEVRVSADNYLYKGGKYYPNAVVVRVRVLQGNRWKSLAILIEGEAHSGVYTFKEWRKTDDQQKWGPVNNDSLYVAELAVPTSYDQVDNFAVVNAQACGLLLKFRPADSDSNHQSQVPGIVIQTDPKFLNSTHFMESELSSTLDGPSIVEEAKTAKSDLKVWAIYKALVNTEIMDSNNQECNSANADFISDCPSNESKLKALKICGSLYTDEKFIKCLARKDTPESVQPNIFRHCVRATCTRNTSECTFTKKLIRQSSCRSPVDLENLLVCDRQTFMLARRPFGKQK